MRLLHASTLQFEEFNEPHVPPYAIVSHRWGASSDEITYQDAMLLMQPGGHPAAGELMSRPGYAKVAAACRQALHDSLNYVWMDTCCIDNLAAQSSQRPSIQCTIGIRILNCAHTYLADVPGVGGQSLVPHGGDYNSRDPFFLESFRSSDWFTRGWTLQELLAPRIVNFFAQDWTFLGTKNAADFSPPHLQDVSTTREISCIIGIPDHIIAYRDIRTASVGARMSWAAKRHTTRLKDTAYCLLGLFGVNLPLLYGEGDKAFVRLQEEIMGISDDQSLFAWRNDPTNGAQRFSGFLAPSPDAFAEAGDIVRVRRGNTSEPYGMTHLGLRINLDLHRLYHEKAVLAVLDCQYAKDHTHRLAIYVDQPWICEDDIFDFSEPQVAELPSRTMSDQRVKIQVIRKPYYGRDPIAGLVRDNLRQSPASYALTNFQVPLTRRLLYIQQTARETDLTINDKSRPPFFLRDMPSSLGSSFMMSQVYPANNWHPKTSTIQGDAFGRAIICFKEIRTGPRSRMNRNSRVHVLLLRNFPDRKAWATFVTLPNPLNGIAAVPGLNEASDAIDKFWDRNSLLPYRRDVERAEYELYIHFQQRACAGVFTVDTFHV